MQSILFSVLLFMFYLPLKNFIITMEQFSVQSVPYGLSAFWQIETASSSPHFSSDSR